MSSINRYKQLLAAAILVPAFSFSQKKNVAVRFVQDQSTFLNNFETNILLKKRAFKIQVLFENVREVYVFASIGDSIYRFSETDSIYNFRYLPLLELKEDRYNSEKELNISETGWSNWFYDANAEWHPFSWKVTRLDNDQVVCTKMIKQFYKVGAEKQMRLKDIREPLYMFFIAVSEYDSTGVPVKELMRRKVKIEWTDDDDD